MACAGSKCKSHFKGLTHLYDVHKLAFNSINVARSAIPSLLFHDSKLGEEYPNFPVYAGCI